MDKVDGPNILPNSLSMMNLVGMWRVAAISPIERIESLASFHLVQVVILSAVRVDPVIKWASRVCIELLLSIRTILSGK